MKVIYFFFFPNLRHLFSFLMDITFFFQRKLFCVLCVVCGSPTNREQPRDSGWGWRGYLLVWPWRVHAAVGRKPQEVRARGRRGRSLAGPPPLPGPSGQ